MSALETPAPQVGRSGEARLSDVTKSWGAKPLLDKVTFTFEAGITYVISGRSGAGKTTLLNMMARYVEPDAGTLELPGSVGYLFQDDMLFSALSARENVGLHAALHHPAGSVTTAVEHCLEAVGMAGRGGDPVSVLSGGERKRIQLAGLLAAAPALVLLDEPTASLDPSTRRETATLFDQVFASTTCAIVSHDEHLADEIGAVTRLTLEDGALCHV